jgi:hypothetical protein
LIMLALSAGNNDPAVRPSVNAALPSKSMSSAMHGEVGAMRIAQAAERGCGVGGKGLAGDGAELRACQRPPVIGEADQALIEGGVP